MWKDIVTQEIAIGVFAELFQKRACTILYRCKRIRGESG